MLPWLLNPASADPATAERLAEIAETLPDAPLAAGTLTLEGHGPRPGATRDFPIQSSVQGESAAPIVSWVVEDAWSESHHLGRSPRSKGDDAWEPATSSAEWLAIRHLGAHPAHLMRFAAASPARVHPGSHADQVLWAIPEGLAVIELVDGRPASLVISRAHPVFGDVEERVTWDGGTTTVQMTEDDVRWSATFSSVKGEVAAVPAPAPIPTIQRVELGPSTWVFEIPDAESRVVCTVNGTEGVFLDVPLSAALGQRLLTEARAVAPDVTDWTVVVSHHHPHYTGGLRPWAAAGARIVVHTEIADWLSEALQRPRMLDPDDPAVPKPDIQAIRKPTRLLDGQVQVRPLDAASGHTDAFLATYIASIDSVYVADLASRKIGEDPRHRGDWPDALGKWRPEHVISGFPVSGTEARWPFALLAD